MFEGRVNIATGATIDFVQENKETVYKMVDDNRYTLMNL